MTPQELLQQIYLREKPFLQTNDWDRLRIRVADVITGAAARATPTAVLDLLRGLRADGHLMFLPDWDRWGLDEDESDGTMVQSNQHWEATPGAPNPPSWRRREVFIPNDLTHWSVRSR